MLSPPPQVLVLTRDFSSLSKIDLCSLPNCNELPYRSCPCYIALPVTSYSSTPIHAKNTSGARARESQTMGLDSRPSSLTAETAHNSPGGHLNASCPGMRVCKVRASQAVLPCEECPKLDKARKGGGGGVGGVVPNRLDTYKFKKHHVNVDNTRTIQYALPKP